MLEVGLRGTGEDEVTVANTAKAFRSGALEVYATPAMISLIEEVCWKMVQKELEPGENSVGTKLDVEHVSPSPVGMVIRCNATLVAIDGRKLTFEVEVKDSNGLIGKGTHERFIVKKEAFMEKANGKLK